MSSNTKVKVPKPVVLPSMRKEHNGYDPKLSLINKGNTHISVGAATTNYQNSSSNTIGGEGKNKDDEDIVSKLRQNGGGWGQSSSSGGNNGVEQQQKSSSGETSSSAGGNDTNFVKIVEVKPIQSTSQWGTNVIAGGSVGGEKNRDGKGGESNVVRVHEHDPSLLGKTNVVSRREEKVTRREFPSLRDSLDPNNTTANTYKSGSTNNITEDADHHWKFEMSSDDRGRYEDGNMTMQRSSRNTSNNGRSQHNRDDNGRRQNAEDASAFLKQNSSIGNVTIMKRNDNDATLNNNANNSNTTNSGGGGANNDREGGESNANKNYVDEARMKFEDEIERVARELEAKKLSSKSSTWAGKSTPATAPPSNTANPLRMLVGNSKQQQVVAVAAAAEIAAAPTPNPTSIAPPSVRREHLTTQQLIEIQLHQQQEQHKRFEQILHQQRAHAKQHQQEEGETGAELLKTRKKRGGRRVREAEERRLLKQTLGATTTTTMPPGAVVKVLSKDPSSGVNSENILRQKPSSSLSTSHRLLRRQQQFEQQQKLTEKLEKDILEVSLDNEEKEEVDNNKRDAGGEDKYNNNIGMDRSASGAYLSGKIEPLRIASPVLSVDNAFGSVWSSSKNAMVNANTDGGVVADTASTLPAQSNTNDDPLFGLDSLDEATATPTTTTIGGGAWNAAAATAGSHNAWIRGQHQQHLAYGQRPRSVPPTSTAHLDVASALPDDLDDEFGSSDSLYDSYNMNNGGEDWDDYNNYLYAQQQHTGAAATAKSSRFNQVLDAPSFFPGEGYSNAAYDSSHPHQSSSALSIEQQYQMYMQSVAQSGSQSYYDKNQYIEMQRDYEEQFDMSDMDFLYHAMQEQVALASATQAGGVQQHHQYHLHGQQQSPRGDRGMRGGRGNMCAQSVGGGKYNKSTGGRGAPHPKNKTGGGQITSRERRRLQRLLTGISKVADPNAVYPTTTTTTPTPTNATDDYVTTDDTAIAAKSSVDAAQTLAAGTAPPVKRGSRGSRGGRRGAKKPSSSPGSA